MTKFNFVSLRTEIGIRRLKLLLNSDEFKIPVKFIGVGEKMTDLQLFNATEFVDSLFR